MFGEASMTHWRQVLLDAWRLRELGIIDERQFREIVAWALSWEIHKALEPQLGRIQDYVQDVAEHAASRLAEAAPAEMHHA